MNQNQDLPHVRQPLVDQSGSASRPYFLWFNAIDSNLKQAMSDIATLQESGGETGGSIPVSARVQGIQSITTGGSLASGMVTVNLLNDTDPVSGHYRYGSDDGGNKGWQSVASDFVATSDINVGTNVNGAVSLTVSDPLKAYFRNLGCMGF